MAKFDRTTLKNWFLDGLIPQGSQFGGIIDSSIDLCASGQEALWTVASLQAGANITLTQTASVITISGQSGFSISSSGQPNLSSTASLQSGCQISLTQTGSVINIATTGTREVFTRTRY